MTEPALLSADEIAALSADPFPHERYQYLRPLSEAADHFIEYLSNPDSRFMLGLPQIDTMTRGFGRGELTYITGRAHSAKTQVILNAVAADASKPVIIFTPDETAELVLAKLIAIKHQIAGAALEDRIRAADPETVELVRRAAKEDFAKLVVIDRGLRFDQMTQTVEEARDFYQEDVAAVIIDFLELLPGGNGDMGSVSVKSQKLKRWTKATNVPTICLHQSSRSSGSRGESAGMDAMKYGGETEAMFVLETYRKRDAKNMDPWEAHRHKNTVTVALHKNKRASSATIGEHDYWLEPATGTIREITDEDQVMPETFGTSSLGDRMRSW